MKTPSIILIIATAATVSLGAAFATATYGTTDPQQLDKLANIRAEKMRELRRTNPAEWLTRRDMAFQAVAKLEAVDPFAHARAVSSPVYTQWQETGDVTPLSQWSSGPGGVPSIVGYRIADDEILINVWIPPFARYDNYRVMISGFGYHFALFPNGEGFQRGAVVPVVKKISLPLNRVTSLRLKSSPLDVLEEVQVLGWNTTYARCPLLAPHGAGQWKRVSGMN